MFELLADSLKALAAYPPVAAFAALGIIGGGVWLMLRGERDRKSGHSNGQTLPAWTLYGPAHDAISAIHDIAEQSRRQTDLLERIDAGIQGCKAALEMIRNESRLR